MRRPRLINFAADFNRTLPGEVDFELRITTARSTPEVEVSRPRNTPFRGVRMTDLRLVDPGRLERPTNGLGNRCSIHLSYGSTRGGKRREGSRKVQEVSAPSERD